MLLLAGNEGRDEHERRNDKHRLLRTREQRVEREHRQNQYAYGRQAGFDRRRQKFLDIRVGAARNPFDADDERGRDQAGEQQAKQLAQASLYLTDNTK